MKKYLLFTFLLIISEIICAQDYQISFTGSGLSTTVDSVEVLNLTQSTSVTLSGSDILHLVVNVGLPDEAFKGGSLKTYPNPMNQSARIEFRNPEAGMTSVLVSDNTGKILLRHAESLVKGVHVYTISGLQSGHYLIQAGNGETNYTAHLVSVGDKTGVPGVKYEGEVTDKESVKDLKSQQNLVQMQYNDGNLLFFKGHSSDYSRIVTMVPTESRELNFEFIDCSDIDNNNYPVVTTGTQTWMAENLKVTHYRNADTIPEVTENFPWIQLTTGAYCSYNNDTSRRNTYGALYNWYAVVDSRELCPTGWHIPSDGEWNTLTDYLGGLSIAGGKMKSTRNEPDAHPRWDSPNTGATNESGFSGLPGGYRSSSGSFYTIGQSGYFWSSSEDSLYSPWYRSMDFNNTEVNRYSSYKYSGFSVRCLKD
ncbi:MAG: T9SS type A sorting domain-containing protein [Bacteroidales bacterium]|nr:T9SS type A sorting domain-containing protein [Bacteroidales bacterium]